MDVTSPIPNLSELVEGDYESHPVVLHCTRGEPEEYPLVKSIVNGLDSAQLVADYNYLREKLSATYILDRKYNLGTPFEMAKDLLRKAGFRGDSYTSLGLMKQGTTELLDIIPEYTRSVLNSFPAKVFRAHYSIARPGWQTSFHGDALNFRRTGFRINLPINTAAHYTFQVNDQISEFKLDTGQAWFVNFCRIHRGSNLSNQDRVCLIFQLNTDRIFQ